MTHGRFRHRLHRGVAAVLALAALAALVGLVHGLAAPVARGAAAAGADPLPAVVAQPALDRARQIVRRISADRARVDEVFDGPAQLTGVVVAVEGGHFIGWLAPRTELLMVGALFDADGRNLTQRAMLARGYAASGSEAGSVSPATPPRRASMTNVQLARALAQSASFIEGEHGPVLSAFVDMNCTYCSELYARSRALIGAGQVRVRWIPVAVIHPDSMARAAALLQARDPVRALAAAQARALPDLRPPNPALQAEIAANNALLSAVTDGHAMTPMLLVQRDDGSFAASAGLPADLAQFAAAAPP